MYSSHYLRSGVLAPSKRWLFFGISEASTVGFILTQPSETTLKKNPFERLIFPTYTYEILINCHTFHETATYKYVIPKSWESLAIGQVSHPIWKFHPTSTHLLETRKPPLG